MKKIIFFFMFFLTLQFSSSILSEDFLCVGRGEKQSGVLWSFEKGKENKSVLIDDRASIFCIERIGNERVIIGGVKKNRGTIWIIEKGSVVHQESLPEAKIIYSIKKASNGTLWAVGTHEYMGACVWRGTDKGAFEISSVLTKGSVAYSVCEGKDGKIFVGGILYTYGKVWIYQDGQWNEGKILDGSRQINTLCVDLAGIVYACGQKVRSGKSSGHGQTHQGAVWLFNGKKWKSGADLADSVDIYCSTIDKQGRIWMGGAGVENKKTVWLLEKGSIQSITLENCLALYSLSVDPDTGILAAVGWNKKLRGRAWFKNPEADWTSGSNISNSFAVTGVIK